MHADKLQPSVELAARGAVPAANTALESLFFLSLGGRQTVCLIPDLIARVADLLSRPGFRRVVEAVMFLFHALVQHKLALLELFAHFRLKTTMTASTDGA